MPGLLPKKPVAVTRINPKIFVLYSKPKVGKTKLLSLLPECFTLDFEGGAEMYETLKMRITSINTTPISRNDVGDVVSMSLQDFYNETIADAMPAIQEAQAAGKKVPFPYKYLAIDTADVLEEMCVRSATDKYKNSVIGKKFEEKYGEGAKVIELPDGNGYQYLRTEVVDWINKLAGISRYLILVCHVREKNIMKGDVAVSMSDLSLAGKLNAMVAAAADAIGYLYREEGKPAMISFKTSEGTTMGSRMPHLAGKTFEFDWNKIYLPE